ncbi:SDR family NAD(P)-dependent oxidoreductase [Aureimonas leprariae]|uniref:SDR family NAD(P)-dependent oxidoreductase n=1 Tax=Plantimonas leprariae TaxID=2615207 RepID=A0A7V7TWB2_9HYPH|nr:SDR family NAD(P)-dependent oxidoreductase [Aureimonas leprariae]KAB0679650.1 SDR family NAD(P)-dependent oxidoreductase [Aureimonas leprariae]
MPHPLVSPDHVAFVTGGASGIGLALAKRFVEAGMRVAIADRDERALDAAVDALGAGDRVKAFPLDVSNRSELEVAADRVFGAWEAVHVLVNNAGIGPGSTVLEAANWDRILAVNLGGVVNGAQVFVPRMLEGGEAGVVVNTGSKQGITTPPGDPAYNVAKAGVKVFTEALEHDLRNRGEGARITAHLLIPGFVFTGLTKGERTEKPAAAWTPEETADFALTSLERGDFYILCPDNDVPRALDEKRIAWSAGDITENRPPLSRWHKDWGERFSTWERPRG